MNMYVLASRNSSKPSKSDKQQQLRDKICRKWGYTARSWASQIQNNQFPQQLHRHLKFNTDLNPLIIQQDRKASESTKYVQIIKQLKADTNHMRGEMQLSNEEQDINFTEFINRKSKEYNDILDFQKKPETAMPKPRKNSVAGTSRQFINPSTNRTQKSPDSLLKDIMIQMRQKNRRLSSHKKGQINLTQQFKLNKEITGLYKRFKSISSRQHKQYSIKAKQSQTPRKNRKYSQLLTADLPISSMQQSLRQENQSFCSRDQASTINQASDNQQFADLDNMFSVSKHFLAQSKQINKVERNQYHRLKYYKQSVQKYKKAVLNLHHVKPNQQAVIKNKQTLRKEGQKQIQQFKYHSEDLEAKASQAWGQKNLSKYLSNKRSRLIKTPGSHIYTCYNSQKQAKQLLSCIGSGV